MTRLVRGIIHGKTIQLDEDLGLAEGQHVEIDVKVIPPSRPWGEGILRTAGALANDPQWDAIIEEVRRGRILLCQPQPED